MEIILQPPLQLLYFATRTTLFDLSSFTVDVAKSLVEEAVALQLLVSGPVYWIYHGCDGRPETEFDLEIGIPVQGRAQPSRFALKWLPPFQSMVMRHAGDWRSMPQTYQQLYAVVEQQKVPITEECRELYWNIDLQQSENNRVEIQIGVA